MKIVDNWTERNPILVSYLCGVLFSFAIYFGIWLGHTILETMLIVTLGQFGFFTLLRGIQPMSLKRYYQICHQTGKE